MDPAPFPRSPLDRAEVYRRVLSDASGLALFAEHFSESSDRPNGALDEMKRRAVRLVEYLDRQLDSLR